MGKALDRFLFSVMDVAFSKLQTRYWDPRVVRMTDRQKREGRKFAERLTGMLPGQLVRLPSPVFRTPFLDGVIRFLNGASAESLVVAFGDKDRNRTRVR